MRFFISLEIPEESKKELEEVQQQVKEIIPEVRLTNNGKLHLTIAFVGEQPDYLKDDLAEVLKKAAENIAPFEITPGFIDGFPNLHSAHTYWVGVKGDIDKLMVIRERVKDGLVNLGLTTDDRRYVPHIAIAKIKNHFKLHPQQETKLQEMMLNDFAPIRISSIKLFESILEAGFHTHNTLAEIPLR